MKDLGRGLFVAVCALGVLVACGSGGGGGTPAPLSLQTLTILTQPVGPESPFGSTVGGDTAELRGTGFLAGLTVRFGAVPATVVDVTSTRVTVTTPVGAEGFADVVVQNLDGTESTLTAVFQYFVPPSVLTALAQTGPTVGTASAPIAGGETVEVTGANFDAATRVAVGGIDLTTTFVDATTLRVTVPAVALEQTAALVVTDEVGMTATLASGFFYTQEFSLEPMLDVLTTAHARHLLRRAGFGADGAAIAAAEAGGLAATVDGLVTITNDDTTEQEAFA
ncbi:MAG: IPT/TIG domain-containing protein, partial [Planctomycetota bacterium]|nr:IPT/TIG domain-containing protein [Planctomycetota bacterium]